jgi:hypothetical protein
VFVICELKFVLAMTCLRRIVYIMQPYPGRINALNGSFRRQIESKEYIFSSC